MELIRKICFNYLWRASGEYKGMHLENWKSVTLPKKMGGGGCRLKYINLFGKSLAARSIWNFMNKDIIWRDILLEKYVDLAPSLTRS
jgi:hypothetical protein